MTKYNRKFTRRLRKRKIRHFDELIHDQSKEWLLKNFEEGADDYPVNVAMLMRNIVWQMRERVKSGQKPPFKELIRTFWYMYIKPTLSRCDSLNEDVNQYGYLSDTIGDMVKDYDLMRYSDIGFRDENRAHRKVGENANIIIFAEKTSEWDLLTDIADKYDVSIIAFGKQPSLLNVEYFVNDIRKTGLDLRSTFYLFSIVDFDTSGWILKNAFIEDLKFYGINNIRSTDLIVPDALKVDELKISRYTLPVKEKMRVKNRKWVKKVKRRNFNNEKYLLTKEKLYGFEVTAVSGERIKAQLEKKIVPVIGMDEDFLRIYEMRKLSKVLDRFLLWTMKRRKP